MAVGYHSTDIAAAERIHNTDAAINEVLAELAMYRHMFADIGHNLSHFGTCPRSYHVLVSDGKHYRVFRQTCMLDGQHTRCYARTSDYDILGKRVQLERGTCNRWLWLDYLDQEGGTLYVCNDDAGHAGDHSIILTERLLSEPATR